MYLCDHESDSCGIVFLCSERAVCWYRHKDTNAMKSRCIRHLLWNFMEIDSHDSLSHSEAMVLQVMNR